MPETEKTAAALLQELLAARSTADTFGCGDLARELDLSRQFVYNLRDGQCHTRIRGDVTVFATEDERYMKIDALCQEHGIIGFAQAAEAQQRAQQTQKRPLDRMALYGARRAFEDALATSGALEDPEVAQLWTALVTRLHRLSAPTE